MKRQVSRGYRTGKVKDVPIVGVLFQTLQGLHQLWGRKSAKAWEGVLETIVHRLSFDLWLADRGVNEA